MIYFSILCFTTTAFSQNYNPDFFPIGVWSIKGDFRPVENYLYVDVNGVLTMPSEAPALHEELFSNLESQGFNAAFMSLDPIGPTLQSILNKADNHNIKIISSMQHLSSIVGNSNNYTPSSAEITTAILNDSINLLKNSPAVLGYYLYDEPLPGWIDFEVLQNAKNILANITSDSPRPILSCWNDEMHMSYIDSYLNLDVLMMDAYPFEDGDVIGDVSEYMPSYFATVNMPYSDYLNLVRTNHCDSQNRPMWVVLQAFGDLETPENGGYWRQVYPKEIRLQVYLSIMQGAKGIWYFLYESEFPYLLGMLDESGQPTQRLTEVTQINTEIQKISDVLLKLRVYNDQSVITIDQGEVKLHYDGSSANQEKYIIAVNTDVSLVSTPTITIQKNVIGYPVLSVINEENNQSIAFTETPTEIVISTPIDEGSGVLLKLSGSSASIDNSNVTNQIKVYPNPVKDNLFIQHDFVQTESYEIYNMLGELVKSGEMKTNISIDLKDVINGVYYLKLNTEYGVLTYKIIKV